MSGALGRIRGAISGKLARAPGRKTKPPIMPEKTDIIEYAFRTFGCRSFADLGGVWGVEGGYSFFALDNFEIERAFLVDTDISPIVEERKRSVPQLTLINANFGNAKVVEEIGNVEAVFLFDTLLHQVSPDWNDVIRMYARITDHFLVYNQQYTGSETVRLIDLGEEEYFMSVPHTRDEEPYKTVFEKMFEINPKHGRINRDIHNIWQWGIVNRDLLDVMKESGHEQVYHKNYGLWPGLKMIENQGFIFKKVK